MYIRGFNVTQHFDMCVSCMDSGCDGPQTAQGRLQLGRLQLGRLELGRLELDV